MTMRKFISLALCLAGFAVVAGCEQGPEEKRERIVENRLRNEALKSELKADSLKREAEILRQEAEALEERADNLRDSSRTI